MFANSCPIFILTQSHIIYKYICYEMRVRTNTNKTKQNVRRFFHFTRIQDRFYFIIESVSFCIILSHWQTLSLAYTAL